MRPHPRAAAILAIVLILTIPFSFTQAQARPPDPDLLLPQKTGAFTSVDHVSPSGLLVRSGTGLNRRLVILLSRIEQHFGRPVTISSGCRSAGANRRAGGAHESYHLRCMAADIRLTGVSEAALRSYVAQLPERGGIGTYCRNSIVHVDVGPRREWSQSCGKIHYMSRARQHRRQAVATARKPLFHRRKLPR